jgi:Preprotein translocase subunit SecB
MEIQDNSLPMHPIQLRAIFVRELHIIAHVPPELASELQVPEYSLQVGNSAFDAKQKLIGVGVNVKIGEPTPVEGNQTPYYLKAEILGQFEVDETLFPVEKLNDWASKNAPMILFPYLREQLYALTLRAGFNPLILPLFQVPTFTLPK